MVLSLLAITYFTLTRVVLLAVLVVVSIYIYRQLRKAKVKEFPESWYSILEKNVAYYRRLNVERKSDFRNRMMVFLSEVHIDGVELEVEELDRVLIAASAVIPVFGFEEWHYKNLFTVLLYPDYFDSDMNYVTDHSQPRIAGMVGTGHMEKQMVLVRKALREGFNISNDRSNTGIHEFVHLIDKADGHTDGVPKILLENQYVIPWLKLIHRKIEEIRDGKSDIKPYGGVSETEFIAVAAEYFFEQPALMKNKHPELYGMLVRMFRK